LSPEIPQAIPILMYHEVGEEHELSALKGVMQRNYLVSVGQFREHLRVMQAVGAQPVSLDQLRDWQLGRADLPARPVVITFDDGFEGNHRHALPILAECGYSATFYIIAGRIGTRHMMSWSQLRELAAAGAEFGSHTMSHALMSTLSAEQTIQELVSSRAVLEQGLGQAVRHFALPFGDRNAHYATAMEKAGYLTGATSEVGLNTRQTDPYQLLRFSVTSKVGADQMESILRQDSRTISAITRRIRIKRSISRVLGKRNYERLASLVYGVKLKPGERLD
jgi:peptidoglycan/xylan/chitin deacetylase (PgdA/CDA1 family)